MWATKKEKDKKKRHPVAPFLLPHKAESEPEKQEVEVRTVK